MQDAVSTRKFLTIEGIEGVGKTTAVRFIQDYLTHHQQQFVLTREPGGTEIAEQLRQILLKPDTKEKITAETELLLMFACRSQHIENVILPALKAGKWVVSDRFVDASYAYQGGGRKLDMTQIEMLDRWVVAGLLPAVTILLDLSPAVGLERAKNRGAHDRIEQEKVDFFERVRAMYLQRAKQFPERFKVIDAALPHEQVQAQIKSILDSML